MKALTSIPFFPLLSSISFSFAFILPQLHRSISNLSRVNHLVPSSFTGRTGSSKLFLKGKKTPVKYIWVKQLNTNNAFKIPIGQEALDFDDFKKEILKERKLCNYPTGIIKDVFISEDGAETSRCDPGDIVPIPVEGPIGSSDENPYIYSVVDQESMASAKKIPKPIMIKAFTKPVSECKNNLQSPHDHDYVDLDRVTTEICSTVYEQLKNIVDTRPLVLMRLACGGKSSTISSAFNKLKSDGQVNPILIELNGSGLTRFEPRIGETQSQVILRLIALQLGDYTPEQSNNFIIDREALDHHLGDNVVLLIDDMDCLGPLDNDAAELLRSMFLDRVGRYLIFTSRFYPSIVTNSISSSTFLGNVSDESERVHGIITVDMPLARTVSDFQALRNMSPKCNALTEERAAWLGYIPSLIYSTMSGKTSPSEQFEQLNTKIKRGEEMEVLQGFVSELIYGRKDSKVGKYFKSLLSIGKNVKVSYPLCYIKEIFELLCYHDATKELVDILNKLECHLDSRNSGMEWESTVKVAIILQMLTAHWDGKQGPFESVPFQIKPDLAFKKLPPECKTMKEASVLMDAMIAKYKSPTLIFVDTTSTRFPQVKGFVVYTDGNPASARKIGFQIKKSDRKPSDVIDTSLIDEAWLIRGNVTSKDRKKPKKGWRYLTSAEVQKFLGNSLLLAMPRGMLADQ